MRPTPLGVKMVERVTGARPSWLVPCAEVLLGIAAYWLPRTVAIPLAIAGLDPQLTFAGILVLAAVAGGALAGREAHVLWLGAGFLGGGLASGVVDAIQREMPLESAWQGAMAMVIPAGFVAALGAMVFTGRRTLAGTGLRGLVRQPGWGRLLATIVLGWASMGVGLVGLPIGFPASIIGAAIVAGLIVDRRVQLLGLILGLVLAFAWMVAREVVDHGSPLEAVIGNIPLALVPGGFAVMLGLVVLTARQAVAGTGIRRLALRGGVVVSVLMIVGAGYVLMASSSAPLQSYAVSGDDRRLTVTAGTGSGAWCRVSSRETTTDVVVGVACTSLILGPSTAMMHLVPFTVDLAAPLGDRTVLNEQGVPIPRRP